MLLCAMLIAATAASSAPNVTAVTNAGPYFALTFDAHAETNGTEQLLALLRWRRVHATIFVTGRFAQQHPEIVRMAAQDGHEIGNHTFNHPHLTTWELNRRHDTRPDVTEARLHDELFRTTAAIAAAIGRPPSRFWRAPYGEHNSTIRAWAAKLGFVHVDWTRADGNALDALDWVENPSARGFLGAEAMARRLIEFERRTGVPLAGSIVLMHLGSARADLPLLEALPIFLDETDHRGLQPIPVGDLLDRSSTSGMAPTGSR